MRNRLFGIQKSEFAEMSACAIQSDTRDMLRQMALPLIPERRVKGALSVMSRDTGLPFSKVRRIYYGITDHILAFEWSAIQARYALWLTDQERKLEDELQHLRTVRATRLQGRLALHDDQTNITGLVAQAQDLASD